MESNFFKFISIGLFTVILCTYQLSFSQLIAEGEDAQKMFDDYYKPLATSGGKLAAYGVAADTIYRDMRPVTCMELEYYLDNYPVSCFGLINQKGDTIKAVFDDAKKWGKDHYVLAYNDRVEFFKRYEPIKIMFILTNDFEVREVYRAQPNHKSVVIRRNGLWGILDRNSYELTTECIYEKLENNLSGFSIYDSVGRWGGYIDAVAAYKNGLWGLISKDNEVLMDFEFELFTTDLGHPVFNGYNLGKKEGSWQYYNIEGKALLPETYDSIWVMTKAQLMVQRDGIWAYCYDVDIMKKWKRTDFLYDTLIVGKVCVAARENESKKWGLIDDRKEAELLVDYEYDDVMLNDETYTVVMKKDGKWGFYKTWKKAFVTEFIYDEVKEFNGSTAVVVINGELKEIKF